MASYPPPYPPPAGAPFGFDAKQQARFARDQIKAQRQAQRAAFKAQVYAYRQQSRAMRRSSILGPLIVVTAGVSLLLIRTGRLPYEQFGAWYLHWWPMLLVVAGVVLVLEWAFDQIPRANGTPYVRRGIGGAGVVLVLTLALTAAWAATPDMHYILDHGLSINPENVGEIFGEKHEIAQPVDADFPAGTMLAVNDPHGDVTIVGKSDDGKLHMMVNKQVWTQSDQAADSKADELSPRVNLSGSTLNVMLPSVPGAVTDVSITMPDVGGITVNASRGAISISGMKAPVTLTANHGDVELNSIEGAVNANLNHRNSSFSAHRINGDISVRGHAQNLNVTDVSGKVSLDGEFFGETHLQHLQGPMSFRTSRTQLSLMRLSGEVDISPSSELTGNQIVGPTILHTSSRNISFDRVAGDIDLTNSKGSVDITSSAPLGNVSIENHDGAVNLTVPEHGGVSVDAETRGGEVENDLGLTATTQNERTWLRGSVADGAARVMIRTNHFDIAIHRGTVQPPVDVAPTPPVSPPVRTNPAKPAHKPKPVKATN